MNTCVKTFSISAIALLFIVGCDHSSDGESEAVDQDQRSGSKDDAKPGIHTGVVDTGSEYWSALYASAEWLAFCDGYFAIRRDSSANPDQANQWSARESEAFEHLAAFRGYEPAVALTRAGWRIWLVLIPEIPKGSWAELNERYDEICSSTLSDLAPAREAWRSERTADK